jgi:predicted transcriptional regulator
MEAIEISDTGIAVMCDIARAAGFDLDANKQSVVDQLIAQGLVVRTGKSEPDPKYKITDKGQRELDARGVGVNEA